MKTGARGLRSCILSEGIVEQKLLPKVVIHIGKLLLFQDFLGW